MERLGLSLPEGHNSVIPDETGCYYHARYKNTSQSNLLWEAEIRESCSFTVHRGFAAGNQTPFAGLHRWGYSRPYCRHYNSGTRKGQSNLCL